jgi:hypothetical protein
MLIGMGTFASLFPERRPLNRLGKTFLAETANLLE